MAKNPKPDQIEVIEDNERLLIECARLAALVQSRTGKKVSPPDEPTFKIPSLTKPGEFQVCGDIIQHNELLTEHLRFLEGLLSRDPASVSAILAQQQSTATTSGQPPISVLDEINLLEQERDEIQHWLLCVWPGLSAQPRVRSTQARRLPG